MFNPFKTPVHPSVMAFDPSATVPDDPDTANDYYPPIESGGLRGGTVQLDDAYIPGASIPNQYRGNVGDMEQSYRPAYAGQDRRVIVTDPSPVPTYDFLSPAPGSTDLAQARDWNSVPGTSDLNYAYGPVTGSAMDSYQEGNRQVLATTPPGSYGPVVGGQDYGSVISNATFQEAFAAYSTAASDQTIVSAI